MLIKGYGDGPLVAGESLLDRPGFWSNYLMAMCGDGSSAARPVPEWFGDDGADTDALSEVLFDPERWPVFRVPAADGPGAVVIYRNLVGDYGTDYLLTHPGRSHAQQIASWEGDFSGAGLTWHELVRIADSPSPAAEGVEDAAARFLLVLPLLTDSEVTESAPARLSATLSSVGAPPDTVFSTAKYLLTHLTRGPRHDPAWGSPLRPAVPGRGGVVPDPADDSTRASVDTRNPEHAEDRGEATRRLR
ncbi:hypothetical protein M8Z33_05225 [Streptomyces sp. ZAF1911]|uniref:hypothetical protein n=1 Tax=Streptomyces sp. ZAF1911 TaxID=2944129 RepID=UPI00237B89B5|nr:hypothetical protein [Streptomyces sp. ZAF1911]MDD9376079.1 hypothetical protein [Streptomyces sp. ZAF1911]